MTTLEQRRRRGDLIKPYLFVNKFDEEDRDDPFTTSRTQRLRGHRKKLNKGT